MQVHALTHNRMGHETRAGCTNARGTIYAAACSVQTTSIPYCDHVNQEENNTLKIFEIINKIS